MTGAEWAQCRKRLGYTQEQLRDQLDLSRQTIVAWEAPNSIVSRVAELALHALEHVPESRRDGKLITRRRLMPVRPVTQFVVAVWTAVQ